MKVTYYVASSIDGYIAKADGDVSWLEELNIPIEDSGYDAFFSTVDALVMGRKTYDMICGFGPWPYGDKPVWICSSGEITLHDGINHQGETSPETVIKAAKSMGVNHLWLVGGGRLAASFLESSLLTNISISQMPIILGGGIKLFGETENPYSLKLKDSKKHLSGYVQIEYEVKKACTKNV